MNWIKNRYLQNAIVVCVSTLFTLSLCNIGAYFWVQNRLKRMQNDNTVAEDRYMQSDMQAFRAKYQNRLDHLRGTRDFDLNSQPSDQLFTVIRPFSTNGKNILLQGDSWANQITWGDPNGANPVTFIKQWAQSHRVGFVAAGVGSYAPSPMTIQLSILRTDFDFHPSTLIAIIDQTDMGDERYRYPDPQIDSNGQVYAIHDPSYQSTNLDAALTIEKNRLIRSNSFALYKLIKYKLLSREDSKNPPPNGDKILEPLRNGVDVNLASTFNERLSGYINEFFKDPVATKLVLVTHPHRNHLIKNSDGTFYQGNVSDLVLASVSKSKYKKRIQIIDISKKFESVYAGKSIDRIFKADDPFSHLTDEAYLTNFLPYVLSQIE